MKKQIQFYETQKKNYENTKHKIQIFRKNKLYTKFLFSLIAVLFFGCQQEFEEEIIDQNQIAFIKMTEVLKSKYSIETFKNSENNFTFNLKDGKNLNAELIGKNWKFSGDALGSETFSLPNFSHEFLIESKSSPFYSLFGNSEGQKFLRLISNTPNSNGARILECVGGESFDTCFVREVDDFCDGAVGCIALFVFPVPISVLIAAHCAACASLAP
jgi:hypothetical protein